MSKYFMGGILTLAVIACFASGISLAQEETEYAYGTVKSVLSDAVVVTEYAYEEDKEIESTYAVNSGTILQNAEALADISAGDDIEIEYVVENNKKIAKTIFVEKQPEAASGENEEYEYDEEQEE